MDVCAIVIAVLNVIAAIFIAVFTGKLHYAGVSKQRAFVFLKRIDFERITINEGMKGYKERVHWMLTPCWENSGETPTKNLTVSVNNGVFNGDLPGDFSFPYAAHKDQPLVIGPRAEVRSQALILPKELVDKVVICSQSPLYVWGEAVYYDIFDRKKRHCTRFCCQITFPTQGIFGKEDIPAFIQYPKYNYAD